MSHLKDPTHKLRTMARRENSSALMWWGRLGSMRADMEMAKTLAQLHEERLAMGHKLDAMDLRSHTARSIVHGLNGLTRAINEITKQLVSMQW